MAAEVAPCKGGRCESTESCVLAARCLYRSSADEARESMARGRHGPVGFAPAEVVAVTEKVQTPIRTFGTGATRDADTSKFDYEGFFSPLALRRFAEYMHKHRVQTDGSLRDSDNWQKGIPLTSYMKSMWRHFMDVWMSYRGYQEMSEDELCALWFNVQGMLHERVRARLK